jgi:hypothetical protein
MQMATKMVNCHDSLSGETFAVRDGENIVQRIADYIRDGIDADSGTVAYRVRTDDGRFFAGKVCVEDETA